MNTGACTLSPSETAGPFPIKSPSDLMMENIISDRTGVALLITLTIQDQSNECKPLAGVFVDVWHCDSDGNYSEYGGTPMQSTNYTAKHFLRGRQTTDSNGKVSFISIFPGWYPGRAPHIHIEVLEANENSIRVTQIAFPKDVCDTVYATSGYNGSADTSNTSDNVFANSLSGNMADSLSGNTSLGYTLLKTIVV
jgi:protocatechuate 3,4-dioxygenase beta subunit